MTEAGPIYGVELIDTLPLGTGSMIQQMPNRADLIQARRTSERTVAGYEVLLDTYRRQQAKLNKAIDLLKRCYVAGHREGWQDGETNTECFDAVNAFLADNIGADWNLRQHMASQHPEYTEPTE